MTTFDRPLAGDAMMFELNDEAAHLSGDASRTARTLVKDGPLRVTLVSVAAGGEIAEHNAPGPITIQPLHGRIRVTIEGGSSVELAAGQLLSAASGVRHSVSSDDGAVFLLTVVSPPRTD